MPLGQLNARRLLMINAEAFAAVGACEADHIDPRPEEARRYRPVSHNYTVAGQRATKLFDVVVGLGGLILLPFTFAAYIGIPL